MSNSDATIPVSTLVTFPSIVLLACVLAGCAEQSRNIHLPEPLKVSKSSAPDEITLKDSFGSSTRNALTASQGLAPPMGRNLAEPVNSMALPKLTGENISVNFEGIKLPVFVNTAFGELLKVSFEIDGAVSKQDLLITLRTTEPLPPEQFFQLVSDVLANHGVSVVYQNGIYRIIEAASAKQDIPQIIRTRSLESIPEDQRPIFNFVPLHNVQAGAMEVWLELALKDRVRITGIPNSNGLLLMGKRGDINAALETIAILDQPTMAGNHSLKLTPSFWSAQKLAEQLNTVLSAEGYSSGIGAGGSIAIKLIPIEALNTIIVFSSDDTTLQHVLQWAGELDQPSQTVNTQGIFYYHVRDASAKKVADLVGRILGQDSSAGGDDLQGQKAAATAQGTQAQTKAQTRTRVIVDESRNALIFQGTAEEYAQFRGLVEQMDRAPLQVLIEATVAEVTLDKNQNLGITLGFDKGATEANNSSVIRSAAGLTASLLRSGGQISANINALASSSRITVLSTPRLMTTSGNSASIQVGSQVPIITTQQTAATGSVSGTSTILQDVQYRNTGILLTIKPTINSNRRVELTISQEVSTAAVNNVSSVNSPIIQQRSIQTTLSMSDGETMLLGGLITDSYNSGDSGVPFLKDISLLGSLFKNQSSDHTRTELIVLLTPYIVDGPEESSAVRDAFKQNLTGFSGDRGDKQGNTDHPAAPISEGNKP